MQQTKKLRATAGRSRFSGIKEKEMIKIQKKTFTGKLKKIKKVIEMNMKKIHKAGFDISMM